MCVGLGTFIRMMIVEDPNLILDHKVYHNTRALKVFEMRMCMVQTVYVLLMYCSRKRHGGAGDWTTVSGHPMHGQDMM